MNQTFLKRITSSVIHVRKPLCYCVCSVFQEWLTAVSGKGLQIMGTFARRQGQITAEMSFTNKALQPMGNFAIQFNKNRLIILHVHCV